MRVSVSFTDWWVSCVRHALANGLNDWAVWLLEHPSVEVRCGA